MFVFFATAGVAFLAYQLLAFATVGPPDLQGQRRVDLGFVALSVDGARWPLVRRIVLVGLIVATGTAVALVWSIGTGSGLANAFGGSWDTFLTGLLVGPLAAIWFNSVALAQADKGLSKGQAAGAAALLVLGAVGSFGPEGRKILGRYASSIEKARFGDFEFSFASRDVTGSGQAGTVILAQGTGDAGAARRSSGLLYLGDLGGIIERDCKYNRLSGALIANVTQKPIDVINTNSSCERTDRITSYTGDHLHMRLFAELMFGDYARCLLRLDETTADHGIAYDSLTRIAPVLRQFASANFHNSTYGRDAAEKIADEAKVVVDMVSSIALNAFMQGRPGAEGLASRPLLQGCVPLVHLIRCGRPAPKQARERPLTWFGRGADNLCRQADAVDRSSHDRHEGSAFRSALRTTIGIVLGPDEDESDPFGDSARLVTTQRTERMRALPYLVIAHADLMAYLGHYEAAGQRLDEWIETAVAKARAASEAPGPPDPARREREALYVVRARITQALFIEEWVRRLGERVPAKLLDYHLENLDQLIRSFERLRFFDAIWQASQAHTGDIERTDFRDAPLQSGACAFKEPDYARLLPLYLNARLLYVFNGLKHPAFDDRYALSSLQHARAVMNADMTCLDRLLEPDASATLRGDALDLFARLSVRAAKARARGGGDTDPKPIEAARKAVALGLRLAEQARTEQDRKRRGESNRRAVMPGYGPVTFSEKITVDPIDDTWSSLKQAERLVGDDR